MVDEAPLSPSLFLSPRIADDLVSLDGIEELLLSGDVDGNGNSAASASTALPSSPIAWTRILDTTTTTSSTASKGNNLLSSTELNSISSSNKHFITNAVHMELQENAKLPTFNLPVDRSNTSWHIPAPRGRRSTMSTARRGASPHQRFSSIGSDNGTTCPLSPTSKLMGLTDPHMTDEQHLDAATFHAIDEMLRLNEHDLDLSMNDVKLCEFFLDGDDRSSAALAYSVASGGMPRLLSSTSLEDTSNNVGSQSPTRLHSSKTTLIPYNRANPLPIPALKGPTPPPKCHDIKPSEPAAAVLAGPMLNVSSLTPIETAASSNGKTDCQHAGTATTQAELPQIATASVPTPAGVSSPGLLPRLAPNPFSFQPTPAPVSNPLTSYTSRAPDSLPLIPPHPLPNKAVARPPGGQSFTSQFASLHAAAHSKTNASIRYATVQRSKFGFGENHTVPSVPAPPTHLAKTHPILGKAAPTPLQPPSAAFESNAQSPNQSGPQYERKKQRAKDARVKLNQSMDELALAIDLAGSQSKMRFDYVVKTTNCKNPHVTPSAGSTTPNTLPPHPLATLMDLTIQQAASAKKWDRPSFVGLSASIINSLNAQCEGLMREVAQLRSIARRDIMIVENGSSSSDQSCSPQKLVDGVSSQQNGGIGADQSTHAAKKQKIDPPDDANFAAIAEAQLCRAMALKEQQRCDAIHNTVGTPSLLQNIASFLDPSSLCQCLCVSKGWRSQNIFQNNYLWFNLCIKRYGAATVRKWEDGEEDGVMSKFTNEDENSVTLKLYRHMAVKNVKPNCPMEGAIFLGGSTSGGLVHCWASLVDRSNGETSRSVMQAKILNGKAKQYYEPLPVVELRLLVQNTGYSKGNIVIPNQQFAVDASTRRTGEKMLEIHGDHRFKSRALCIYGSGASTSPGSPREDDKLNPDICRLRLFESAIVSVHIHAKGCSTISKFRNRSKRIQLLVSIDGTIRQLVIPFHCMNEHNLKQIVN
ncbi:hypothetical protein ACHAWU_004999 [Discostella pseudostelligera]|uniref:F-box domain-containing protein n=1 Tax=Discostella pseudostelligera TaxID=259834 RepID=A0ABD3MGR1_9STRA